MSEYFRGKWRGVVIARTASFAQRVRVHSAADGNGTYAGAVGTSFLIEDGLVDLEWNNDAGSGWQPSGVLATIGMTSPLVVVRFMYADDDVPNARDGDYDDLVVMFESLDPPFEITQRPFALEQGSLTMMPDGIFDASQGVCYMGVRIRNHWFLDWDPAMGMKIGIANASRASLAAGGVKVLDGWTTQEQARFGQVLDGGFVRVPDLAIGEETTIYFKVDVRDADPSKPAIGLVAQRDAFDPHYDAPSRVAHRKIFISRCSYDKDRRELVAVVPEGRLRLKLHSIKLDLKGANDAAKELMRCLAGSRHGAGNGASHEDRWVRSGDAERDCRERGAALLRDMLKQLLDGGDIDICRLRELLDRCCPTERQGSPGGGGRDDGSRGDGTGGGWQQGTGVDGWCRVKPVGWLPVGFSYRVEPNPAYTGQFGPLPFEDPWWKVILIVLAALLALASLVYDYVEAGQDKKFIIGRILRNGNASAGQLDCAVCDLDGSRAIDLGQQDAQGDDVNNGAPVEQLGSIIQIDRTDNGDSGIQDAVLGNVVWKSGARSGTTRGVISSLSYATTITYDTEDTISGNITFSNQVMIGQVSTLAQPVSQAGDSGSVWIDMASKRPVALNFAGDTSDAGTTAVGNPIRQVADTLGIRFNP